MKTRLQRFLFIPFLILTFIIVSVPEKAQSQWTQVNYNFFQKVIRTLYSSGDTVFAGLAGQGVYISTNRGANWTQTPLNNQDVYSISVYGNLVYAGTTGGVFYSSNRGANWANIGLSNIRGVVLVGGTVYAANYNNWTGVYMTTNNGANWIQTPLNNQCMLSLAACGNNVFGGTDYNNIYLSSNNGISWTSVLSYEKIYSIFVYGDTVYAGGGYNSIYRSTNKGLNWTTIWSPYNRIYSIVRVGSNIYAGLNVGTYVSTNSGSTWAQISTKNTLSVCYSVNTLFSGTDNGLYSTTDNGVTWSTPPPSNIGSIKQTGVNLYAGASDGVYFSPDGGMTWAYKGLNQNVNTVLIDGSRVYAGTGGTGVYYTSNDGANWTQTSLTGLTVNSILKKDSVLLAGTTTNGVYYSTNSGTNWFQSNLNITTYALYQVGSNLFAGTSFGGVYISTNNGLNWTQTSLIYIDIYGFYYDGTKLYAATLNNGIYSTTNNGINWAQTGMTTNTFVSFSSYGSSLFAGTNGIGVYLTKNGGANWTQSNDGMSNQNVRALWTYGNYVIAGSGGAGIWRRYILEFAPIRGDATLDSLVNVLDVTATVNYILGNNPSPFSFLAADVNTDNNINVLDIVGIVNIILHPTNRFFAHNEQTDKSGTAFLTLQNNQLNLTNTVNVSAMQFKLSGTGLNGVTFTPSSQLSNYQVAVSTNSDTSKTYVIFNMSDTSISTGVHNLGTFTGLNSGVTMNNVVIADEEGNGIITGTPGNQGAEIPKDYYLGQNFPNPFNPVTMIKFAIPKSGITTLKIYDVTGRLVNTLVDGYIDAGYYEREFNASSLSSGIYFYTLNSGSYSAVKKMAVIK